jgi:hypothetical protein
LQEEEAEDAQGSEGAGFLQEEEEEIMAAKA